MRKHVSYANVVATLALVVAVGTGGAWAASQIDGSQLKNRTVAGKKLKFKTVTNKEINQASLGKLVHGGGTLLSGHLTAPAGGPPGASDVVKTFSTTVGRIDLSCQADAAGARYTNTTAGTADVFRAVQGNSPGTNAVEFDQLAVSQGAGWIANEAESPVFLDIRAGKRDKAMTLRVGERFAAGNCFFDWEFVASK